MLEYFDAFLVGLTATPAKHTLGFFDRNLVMEYGHEQAVADGVNVDFEVYKIRTRITAQGSTIEAEHGAMVGYRHRQSRKLRWEAPDEDISYGADALDRAVVAKDQIRLIVRTFRDRLFTDLFPGRTEVPTPGCCLRRAAWAAAGPSSRIGIDQASICARREY